jgi:hypothetical protein
MPRNGSGIYSLPSGYLAETGELILADQHNDPLEDIKDDLNAARPVVAGGTGSTTASGARSNLSVYSQAESNAAYVKRVTTKTALKALDTASYKSAFLEETGVQKMFAYTLGNFTTAVAGDPSELIYIPADGILVSIGCWVAVTGTGASIGASLVTPTGATTPGFVADILAREYWVEDFGAVGDGTTDDRTAINLAISTISAAGGGCLRFRAKTYAVSRGSDSTVGVLLKSNVILRGAGVGLTVIKARNGTSTIHLIGNASADGTLYNSGLIDLTVDHNKANFSVSAVNCHAIRVQLLDGFYVNRIHVKNAKQHAFATLTVDDEWIPVNKNIFVSNYSAENAGEDGFRIFYGAENVNANNILVRGAGLHAVHIGFGSCNITNVTVYQASSTAVSVQSDGVNMSNVHIEWDATCDLLANRPAAGNMGALFIDSATETYYYDDGVSWLTVGTGAFVNGLWAITRGNFPTGGHSNYSNIKIVLNITENQTMPNMSGTTDGFRLDVPNCECSNIQVYGKFRFGVYTTESDNSLSNVLVDGARQDGIRLAQDRNTLNNWRVITASTASAGAAPAVNLYGSYTKVSNGYALDTVNVATAILEQSGEDYNQVYGNHLEGTGAKLSLSGLNSRAYENTGLSYTVNDLTAVNSPDDTATNVLKTYTITSGEFRSGQSIEVECFGNVTGTGGTKVIRAFIGTNYFTIASEASGDTQDWGFRMRIRRFSGTGYSVEVFGGEEAGTAAPQYGRFSISGNFAVGVDATLSVGTDNVGVTGFFIYGI